MNKHACWTRRLVNGWSVWTLGILLAAPAFAQDPVSGTGRSQFNLQATVPLQLSNTAMDALGNPLTNDPTRSAGFMLGYAFTLNKRFRVGADYGVSRNSQRFMGSSGTTELQGDMNQLTVEMDYTLMNPSKRFVPYALAGTGAIKFAPTDFTKSIITGAQSQANAVFLYGGGADYLLGRGVGIRGEYRGLVTKAPNFKTPGLGPGGTANIAEPSIGLFFRF